MEMCENLLCYKTLRNKTALLDILALFLFIYESLFLLLCLYFIVFPKFL